jgi:hypothetical protein
VSLQGTYKGPSSFADTDPKVTQKASGYWDIRTSHRYTFQVQKQEQKQDAAMDTRPHWDSLLSECIIMPIMLSLDILTATRSRADQSR